MKEIIKIVEGAFEMDTLGIKDKVRTSGLSKNFKKEPGEWSPREMEVDEHMIVDQIPPNGEDPQHYTCRVPWKNGVPNLQNNLKMVMGRQKMTNYSGYLEKKGTNLAEVDAKFQDMLDKGYIEEVTDINDINRKDSYLEPYFPVVDKTRETTKLRIVFDAAAVDANGKSLNSEIEKGPNMLNDLFQILLRFRQYEYAVQADISEMFLRIRLHEDDKKYHRFYWNGKIWQWTRTLFGNRASPDISQKVLTVHANKMIKEFPLAAHALKYDTYVDDTIKSLETEKSCCELVKQLQPLVQGIDMKIMKFYSNSKLALRSLPKELLSKKVNFEEKEAIFESSKVLGMEWDADTDLLRFHAKFQNVEDFFLSLKITKNPVWTKRLILKLSATVYDPLGLISPYTVKARSILQELWKIELGWDDAIPQDYAKRWSDWLVELFQLAKTISIPRFLQFRSDRTANLDVFCDASQNIFACCVYVRITEKVTSETTREENDPEEKVVAVSLVTSKARVAPSKTESIARLELSGCVIAVRLGNAVAEAYGMDPKQIRYWTDSTNCLFWITSPSSVMKTFVSNRVGEVQNESLPENWRHVPTDQNPADIATRPPKVEDLKSNSLWWNGPAFLMKQESEWPAKFIPTPDDAAKEEFKKDYVFTIRYPCFHVTSPTVHTINRLNPQNYAVGKYWNGFNFLIKNTALVFQLASKKITPAAAMRRALEFQIKRCQDDDEELDGLIKSLQNTSTIPSKFLTLTPFIDENGILRSKSRLADITHLPYNTRFPVILNADSPFTHLLVASAHQEYEHTVNIESAKAKLKDSYFILGLENHLRFVRKHCMTCKKERAAPYEQRIANLPKYRFERPLRAFAKTGLDFTGAFEIKVGRATKRQKTYILLFTCMQTRAVHLEVTLAMDINKVVNAFTRFINMRGMPTDILSDNWKTFVSKDKELEQWVRNLDSEFIISQVSAKITWHFTPPHGPHHGGIYEILVKATKRCLRALCNYKDLDKDEFDTFVSSVASLLNGRPITKVQVENESQILTPNHFLIGNLGGAVSTSRIDHPATRWQEIHHLVKQFWQSFFKEYLVELRKARIWKTIKPNVEVGDLVLEIKPDVAPGFWQLAIVREVMPSADGLVRSIGIENDSGKYIRPITKLCPLEFNV